MRVLRLIRPACDSYPKRRHHSSTTEPYLANIITLNVPIPWGAPTAAPHF